jgi:peptide methionine sulfoxide reductase msrA/msrB
MRRVIAAFAFTLLLACNSSGSKPTPAGASNTPVAAASVAKTESDEGEGKAVEADSVAYFAGGCFWGVEHYLEMLDGVVSVESGYMGGTVDNPTYRQVTGEKTGHYESVEVRYDSKRIDYETVAKEFFEIHDPTQADGQGPDIGPQYRSAIFVSSPKEREIVEGLIERLKAKGFDVVTEIKDADEFWPAEEYHQNYYVKTGKKPYCHGKVDRFGDG